MDFLPDRRELQSLQAAARKCEGCRLHANATQTVFGEGPTDAKLVLVGEQPGDEEDRARLCGTATACVACLMVPESVNHAGVRIGRKTYLVDMAGGTKRTDYVAVSNTVIGVLLLVTGGVSALASLLSVEAVLILLGLMGAAGTISALRLEDV